MPEEPAQTPARKSNRLALRLRDRVPQTGLSLPELAAKTELHYEHLRRILGGQAHPDDGGIAALATVLNLPLEELRELSLEDQVINRFGRLPNVEVTQGGDLASLSSDWMTLTPDQQRMFRIQIRAVADDNRRFLRTHSEEWTKTASSQKSHHPRGKAK